MDAPSALTSTIYDPETDPNAWYPQPYAPPAHRRMSDILQVGAQQPVPGGLQPPRPAPTGPTLPPIPGANSGIRAAAPSGPVTAIPQSELGVAVIRTTNARDMQIVLEILEFVRRQAEGTEPELRLVPLRHQDCTTVAGILNSVFARVQVGQQSNVIPQAVRQQAGNPFAAVGPSVTQNVYCIAMPRYNALLIAGPKGRFADIIKEVEKLDIDNTLKVKAFPLKKASAQVVGMQLRYLYSQRFPQEGPPFNLFRVNFDLSSNSVLVTASPADMKDVEELIEILDTMVSNSKNDLRIFALRNAFADEVATLLIQSISANVVSPLIQSQGQPWYLQSVTGTNLGALGGIQALLGGAGAGGAGGFGAGGGGGQGLGIGLGIGQGQGAQNAANAVNLNAPVATVGSAASGGLTTKTNALRFYSTHDGQVVETGLLEDVHIVPYARTNSLLVAAKPETMKLIEKLLENLDTVAAARAYINIFQLKTADAAITALMLQQLFTGAARTGITPQGGGGGAVAPGAAPTSTTTNARPLLTLFDQVSPGAQLIDLRISVDDRTNSLIVAGSFNDLETIRSIIAKLETSPVDDRQFQVYKLRNQAAADIATALTSLITAYLAAYSGPGYYSAYLQMQRNMVIVAEPVSNTILISATPHYLAELKRIIERLDAQPPQVVIQVLIADVQLSNNEEIGVEYGVQSPILFQRGSTLNFNSTAALPTGNVSSGTVGFQGLGNLGVGRASSLGPGGFVFSAQSEAFNLLVRALKAQGRIEILSRPQIHITDNQTGYINIGQSFPTPSTSTLTGTGAAQTGVNYIPVGVTMRVTPRVNPDGKVLMRVEPQVSSVATTTISLGSVNAPIINNETVETTVLASDGETIVIGGLISKSDSRNETGIPFLKDVPYVGALFRYRTQATTRREILFIMTPTIVRSEYDTAKVLAEESRRLSWCVPEIGRYHGHGLEVIGPAMQGANPIPVGGTPPGQIPPGMLPGGEGPGFVPVEPLPGPGLGTLPSYGLPGGPIPLLPPGPGIQSNPAIPGAPMIPGGPVGINYPAGQFQQPVAPFQPPIAAGNGVPIVMPGGTISPASARVFPGATPFIVPAVSGTVSPVKNGYLMGSPLQPALPAPDSNSKPSKEAQPWAYSLPK
ncbi:MAG TPA: secretin N-terminal domain-containing protein [Urbifossiella sp.]|nr:secretin N-terminal domain-containing protein [Urbifossiella sp.]